jgi:uncharacterized membrane protein
MKNRHFSSERSAERSAEQLALNKVHRVKGFLIHLLPYVLVVSGLTVVNLLVSPRYLWVLWVACGWGVGLLIHGLVSFGRLPFSTPAWERKQLDKYLARRT